MWVSLVMNICVHFRKKLVYLCLFFWINNYFTTTARWGNCFTSAHSLSNLRSICPLLDNTDPTFLQLTGWIWSLLFVSFRILVFRFSVPIILKRNLEFRHVYFFFLTILVFQLRPLCLLDKCCAAWTVPPELSSYSWKQPMWPPPTFSTYRDDVADCVHLYCFLVIDPILFSDKFQIMIASQKWSIHFFF
jgi:hypothetical protein